MSSRAVSWKCPDASGQEESVLRQRSRLSRMSQVSSSNWTPTNAWSIPYSVQCSSKDLHAEHIPHLQGNMYHVREAWVFRSFSASSPTTVVKIHRDYPEAAISICVARGTYYGRAPAPLRHPCPLPCVIDSRHLEAECSGGSIIYVGFLSPKYIVKEHLSWVLAIRWCTGSLTLTTVPTVRQAAKYLTVTW